MFMKKKRAREGDKKIYIEKKKERSTKFTQNRQVTKKQQKNKKYETFFKTK